MRLSIQLQKWHSLR